MTRSVNLGDDVDTTLEVWKVNNGGKGSKGDVYLVGIIYDICNLGWCVGLFT